jgi:hypothetical protein
MGRGQTSSLTDIAEHDLEDRIESYLFDQIKKAQIRNPFQGPTVGLEQEFFVFKLDGVTPADLSDTQAFLKIMSSRKGWRAIESMDRPYPSTLTRVSYEQSSSRYSAIKYEFPPHLLEIAFTYYDNLHDLNEDIASRWKEMLIAADECNLRIALKSFIEPPNLNFEDQIGVDPKLPALAESRRAYFKRRGEPIDLSIVDFPSFVAATQTQVSVPGAWGSEDFMHRLYALELSIMPLLNRTPQALEQRQKYYDGVFRGLKLLGIPDMEQWTLREWIQTLCDSPLVSNLKAGSDTLRKLWANESDNDLEALLKRTRDLQIVRPKSIGTVEFRGDASVTKSSDMIRVAATRFGGALIASDASVVIPNEELSLGQIRAEWQKRIRSQKWNEEHYIEARLVYQSIKSALQSRGRGEEKYLFELYTSNDAM